MSTESVFERFEIYPFDADPVFQNGLPSIVAPLEGKPVDVVNETIGKAKAFYFSRLSGEQLSWNDYVQYCKQRAGKGRIEDLPSARTSVEREPQTSPSNLAQSAITYSAASGLHGTNPPPLSFLAVADLLKSGQAHLIPNNEIIPDKLSEEEPSESRAPIREKPWETKAEVTIESSSEALAS